MTTTISGSNGIVFPDATSMQTGQQAAKAWVNFNGTGTVAIRAGYNVSSITDNGTGDYSVNFTTAMVDANYGAALAVGGAGTDIIRTRDDATARTTSLIRIITLNNGFSLTDSSQISVTIFR